MSKPHASLKNFLMEDLANLHLKVFTKIDRFHQLVV